MSTAFAPGPRALVIASLLAATAATGCGGPREYQLEGSLSELVELQWRSADILTGPDELTLRFIRPQGAGENVVLRVTVSLLGTTVDAREPLDLAEEDTLGNQRGKVTRAVAEDPLTTFPPLQRGSLTFDRTLTSGEIVQGDLHITFANGTELASGRTVFGDFEAKVQ